MEMMVTDMTPRLPEIGKIKIGGLGEERLSKKGKKFRMPEKYDYFKITKNIKDAKGDFIIDDNAMKILGEKPKKVPIRLLFNDLNLCWQSRYVRYEGNTCVGRGDGTSFEEFQKGEWVSIPRPEKQLDPGYTGRDKWKLSGVFTCILDLKSSTLGGVWRFRTTSFNSCNAIPSSLILIASQTGGHLQGIPLDMVVTTKDGVDPTGRSVKVPIVSILYRGTIEDLQNNARELIANVENVHNTKLLETVEVNVLKDKGGSYFNDDSDVGPEFFSEEGKGGTLTPKPKKLNIEDAEEIIIEDAEITLSEDDYKTLVTEKFKSECSFNSKSLEAFHKDNLMGYSDLYNDPEIYELAVISFLSGYINTNKGAMAKALEDSSKLDNLPADLLGLVALYKEIIGVK